MVERITNLNLDRIDNEIEMATEETENEREQRLVMLREKLIQEKDVVEDKYVDTVWEIDNLIEKIENDEAFCR